VAWYLDTSAFLKLVAAEAESTAMREWFRSHTPVWSSQLLLTEAWRAAIRLDLPDDVVEAALATIWTVLPSATTFYAAGRLSPPVLRSLDAIHLATALEMGADLEGVVGYDERLIAAAKSHGLPVVSPA